MSYEVLTHGAKLFGYDGHLRDITGVEDTYGVVSSGTMMSPRWLSRQRKTFLPNPRRNSSFRPWNESRDHGLLMGCVIYHPSVVEIWTGIQSYLHRAMGSHEPGDEVGTSVGSPFDFVLFTNYGAQVRALLDGHIDVAWNGPIAHVLSERGASASGRRLLSLGMRDVDRDFRSIVVGRKGDVGDVRDLEDQLVLAGTWDSPQANLVPLHWLRNVAGVRPKIVKEYDFDVGKHGDTALGEVRLLQDLCVDDAAAGGAVLSQMMWDRALRGELDDVDPDVLQENYRVLPGTQIPPFDHCQFDAIENPHKMELFRDFSMALMEMDMNDPEQKRLMCLEGIKNEWMPPRQEGYDIVRQAMDVAANLPDPSSSRRFHHAANLFQDKSAFLRQRRAFSSTTARFTPETVAVIGAGVAGLQTARALRSHGFRVACFDSNSKVGGLWNSNYSNFGVQVPKQLYEMQDFPMLEAKEGEYPTAVQVQTYLERMAKAFRLEDAIELNTTVEGVEQNEDGTWNVMTNKTNDPRGGETRRTFDYLVSATGLYSNRDAFLPSYEGERSFQGRILHSSRFVDASIAKGRRVVVVGGAKSAVDCAVEARRAGASHVTLLSRKAHWPTPRKIAGIVPFQYVFLSRFGTALVSAHRGVYPDEGTGTAVKWFRKLGRPIVGGAFYAVEALFRWQLGLFGDRSPKTDVVEDFYGECIFRSNRRFFYCSSFAGRSSPSTSLLCFSFVRTRTRAQHRFATPHREQSHRLQAGADLSLFGREIHPITRRRSDRCRHHRLRHRIQTQLLHLSPKHPPRSKR